jgi:hypothetical protein
MNVGQGLAMVLAGVAAGRLPPGVVIVVGGAVGAAAALVMSMGGPRGRHVAGGN